MALKNRSWEKIKKRRSWEYRIGCFILLILSPIILIIGLVESFFKKTNDVVIIKKEVKKYSKRLCTSFKKPEGKIIPFPKSA